MNRAVQAEQTWAANRRKRRRTIGGFNFNKLVPRLVGAAAFVGVSSYSLYLTHELVIMQSYSFSKHSWHPVMNTLIIVVPATVLFAWIFFLLCEKPFMRKAGGKTEVKIQEPEYGSQPAEVLGQTALVGGAELVLTPDA